MENETNQPAPVVVNVELNAVQLARQMLKKEGGGKDKFCGVCGKPESRNTAKVNEVSPNHKEADDKDYAKDLRLLEKALGSNTTDLGLRTKFNAQREWLVQKLAKARAEHDQYQPETPDETNKAALTKVLHACLEQLGSPVEARSEGWTPLQLADVLFATIVRATEQGQ